MEELFLLLGYRQRNNIIEMLDHAVDKAIQEKKIDPVDIESIIDALRNFADGINMPSKYTIPKEEAHD